MAGIHTKTALDYMRRAPFQALSAIFVLALTFFVGTLMAVLIYSSGQVLTYFETRPQIIAFLSDEVDSDEVSSLQLKISTDPRVKEVRYVSKEEALEIYRQATADNPLLSELVSPTIFPASLEFSLTDLAFAQEVISEVREEPIVEQVGFTASLGGESTLDDVVSGLRTISWYLRVGGITFSVILAATSFLVLLVIIGMRMATRRGEIEILNLIGATSGFIRSPIIIEAMLYAFIGVFLGWTLAFVLILYLAPPLITYFGDIPVLPRQTMGLLTLFGIIFAVEIAIGFILALTGSMLAVTRARRNR